MKTKPTATSSILLALALTIASPVNGTVVDPLVVPLLPVEFDGDVRIPLAGAHNLSARKVMAEKKIAC